MTKPQSHTGSVDPGSQQRSPGRRGIARRKALLEAAEALFIEQGYESTSLTDLIERAGGSRATLYAHFGDKEGLFRAVLDERNRRMMSGLSKVESADPGDPKEDLLAFARQFIHTLMEDSSASLLRVLVAEGTRVPDIAWVFLHAGPETTVARVALYLERLKRAGTLDIEDPSTSARVFLGMVTGNLTLKRLIQPDLQMDQDELDQYVEQAVDLFLNGAGVLKLGKGPETD